MLQYTALVAVVSYLTGCWQVMALVAWQITSCKPEKLLQIPV
jgi:hypothetical protein